MMLHKALIRSLESYQSAITKELLDMIQTTMKETKEIVVPNDIYDYDISYAICYDGGNHPEYASNCYSCIERIYYNEKNDSVLIDVEDGVQELNNIVCVSDLFVIVNLLDFLINGKE